MDTRFARTFIGLLLLLGGCTASHPVEFKPTLPGAARTEPLRSFEKLKKEIHASNRALGAYPPSFGERTKPEVYEAWADLFMDTRAYETKEGTSERVLWALSELYRQGHNMDVQGAGTLAIETIDYCLQKYPKSLSCNFSSVYFYLAVAPSPENLAKAETSLKFLRKQYLPKLNEEVEDAYVYLYAYQNKKEAALKQIDRYLSVFPRSPKRAAYNKVRSALRANQHVYPGPETPGPSGAMK